MTDDLLGTVSNPVPATNENPLLTRPNSPVGGGFFHVCATYAQHRCGLRGHLGQRLPPASAPDSPRRRRRNDGRWRHGGCRGSHGHLRHIRQQIDSERLRTSHRGWGCYWCHRRCRGLWRGPNCQRCCTEGWSAPGQGLRALGEVAASVGWGGRRSYRQGHRCCRWVGHRGFRLPSRAPLRLASDKD